MDFKTRYQYNPTPIGSGGFASVYKATDTLLNRVVALKFFTNKDGDKHTLIKEISRAIQLEHPNLCRYYDASILESVNIHGASETHEIGVLEYLDGGDIGTYVKKHPKSCNKLLTDVLLGLSYLHEHGIIHRDIKPANILIKQTSDGPVAKITDFGISKASTATTTKSSDILGTIEYMAPEQFNTSKYGIKGKINTNLDLWSWGCVAYDLITGDSLFGSRQAGTSTEQILSSILHDDYEQKFSTVSEPFRSALRACMVKDAKERVQTAADLLKILRDNKNSRTEIPVTIDSEKTRVIDKKLGNELSAEKPIVKKEVSPKADNKIISAQKAESRQPSEPRKLNIKRLKKWAIAGTIIIALGTAGFIVKNIVEPSKIDLLKKAVRKNIEALSAPNIDAYKQGFAADALYLFPINNISDTSVLFNNIPIMNLIDSTSLFLETCSDYKGEINNIEVSKDLVIANITWSGTFNEDYKGIKVKGQSFKVNNKQSYRLDSVYKITMYTIVEDGLKLWLDSLNQIAELKTKKERADSVAALEPIYRKQIVGSWTTNEQYTGYEFKSNGTATDWFRWGEGTADQYLYKYRIEGDSLVLIPQKDLDEVSDPSLIIGSAYKYRIEIRKGKLLLFVAEENTPSIYHKW